MADMKYLNTRIQMKYDSFENWSKAENQKDLLPGEIAIAYLGPTQTTANPDNGTHPVLFKVGPGKFNDLPWASALAADVYSWAKQSENDFVSKFLALKMSDGTTMQTKLDAVFATDAELAKAIEDIRKDIPTALGVMSVAGSNAIKTNGTDNVTVSLALDNSGNVELSQSNTGLKAAIDLSAYRKIADDEDTITTISAGNYMGTITDNGADGNHAYVINGKDWTQDIATAISNSASTEGGVISNVIAKADAAQEAADEAMDKAEEGVTKAEAAQIAAEAAQKTIDDFLTGEGVKDTVDTLIDIQAELERLGDAVELETQFAAKADKVKDATKGNFAGLDENGNLTDSGKKAADFATAEQGAKADAALPTATFNSTIANYYTKTEADAEFMDAEEVSAAITNALTGAGATVKVQNAVNADNAKEATHAVNADNATNATNATNAVNAENATRAEDATHADAAAKVDKSLTITAGSSNTVFDGSAEKTLDLDAIYLREHQDLSNYKTKQDPYSNAGSTTKTVTGVVQNENGEITVTYGNIAFPAPVDISGKKDKQEAVENKIAKAAHVLSSLTQNANGDIAYEVKELTPADIGAQPAGDYATKTEMSNQDAAILAEAQKYADSLNHEDTKYAAAVDGGLKLNENNEFAIDDSVTFVFRCGSATELI